MIKPVEAELNPAYLMEEGKGIARVNEFDYGRLLNRSRITGDGKDIWIEFIDNLTVSQIDQYAEKNQMDTEITLDYRGVVYGPGVVQVLSGEILVGGIQAVNTRATNNHH